MTTLHNSIRIDASPGAVWDVLADLERLAAYDPVVDRSTLIGEAVSGLGAARRCEVQPKGAFEERVTEWAPPRSLAFELYTCTLPVHTLTHRYELEPDEDGTIVRQRMDYRLKMGPVGVLMDVLMVRRQWDRGIKAFMAGLKSEVERARASAA